MEKKTNRKYRITLTIMALVLTLAIATTATYSWIEGGTSSYVKGNAIEVSTSNSLIMKADDKVVSNITIPKCSLDETSSADGRNFFFPLSDNTSNQTASMTFREGTDSDRNTKYVSLDFDLISGDTPTDVYLGSGTIVQCSNSDVSKALRMSFSCNDGTTPVVFKPNQMPGVQMSYSPITAINDIGDVSSTGTTNTQSYGDYYYKGDSTSNQLFSLSKKETKHITLNLWLEGTNADFTDEMAQNNLKIYVDFSTSVDKITKYNLVDNTHGYGNAAAEYWLSNKDTFGNQQYDTMMYIHDNSSDRYYLMEKTNTYTTDHTWIGYIPQTITNFSFRRYCIDIDKWWNEWQPDMGSGIKTDHNGEYTYVAICGNPDKTSGTEIKGNGGYWKDQDGTYRVFFQDSNSTSWSKAYCYAWKGTNTALFGAFPGKEITSTKFSRKDGTVYHNMYYVDLKETDNVSGIIFSNGSYGNGNQTTNLTNLFSSSAYWYDGTNSGNWLFTDSAYSSYNLVKFNGR